MFRLTRISSAMTVAFGSLLGTFAPLPVQAQQVLERVEITGSSIKRIDAETSLPVQVITREQIQKSGAINVEQLLQTVPSIASSGGLTAASTSGATTGGISAISLHGLTSQRTLVLVNGRRIAPYGTGFTGDSVSVDVNSIPLAAIERVEVLKDGASAVYGSDAIAGVVNFILRQEYQGAELTAEYGGTTRGGANFKRASGLFGLGNLATDRFNVLLVASYQKEGSLVGGQRDFARSGIRPYELNDATSGNTFPANIVPVGTTRSFNPTAPTGCLAPYSTLDPLFNPRACRFDPAPFVTLIPGSERSSLFASGKFAITDAIQAYAEASYNRNEIRTLVQPVPISDQFALPPNNVLFNQAPYNGAATILLTPASRFYPTAYLASVGIAGNPDLLVRYRNNTNRDITDINEAPRAVLGVKGTVVGWDFDVAGLYSESKVREHVNSGFPAYSKILPILNSGNVNFFGPNSADVDASLRSTEFTGEAFNVKSSLTSISAKASSEVLKLPSGMLGLAFGVEGRKEKYLFSPSEPISSGDISGYGGNFLVTDKSRSVSAVFAEANIPIVKNLEAGLAVRYDHYEGVGNSTTPKGSLRWQPVPEVLLRTSYGKGFRAPSLQDLYLPNTTGVTPPGLNDPKRCIPPLPVNTPGAGGGNDCNTQFAVTFGGNAQLKPEKSKNFTLGAVLEPARGLSVGIDYFRVKLTDTIVNGVDTATILSDPDKYAALIARGPVNPAFPNLPGPITNIDQTNINLGTTKVSGFDVDLRYRVPSTAYGRFTLGATATYFSQFDTSNLDGSFTGGVDQVNAATGGVVPRFKSYLSVDWSYGPWSVTAAQNFQKGYNDLPGTFEDPSDPAFVPRRVKSYATYDLQSTYTGFKSWRLTLGARNIFNTDPPYSNAGGQTGFQSGYDAQYGDPRGRFIYGRVTYAFE